MAIRTINAPGIQLNEIDRSNVTEKVNNSLVNTITFVCGFGDKGEDYTIEWIDNLNTFVKTYGYPTNEAEKYFYNAANEVLATGGILLTAKLPYDNLSKDSFTYVDYNVSKTLTDISSINLSSGDSDVSVLFDQLSTVDSTLTSFIEIYPAISGGNSEEPQLMTMSQLDNCRTRFGFSNIINNGTFRIVDITRSKYDPIYVTLSSEDGTETIKEMECLGLLPVITTPINSLFFQEIIKSNTDYSLLSTDHIELFNPIKSIRTFSETADSESKLADITDDSYSVKLCSKNINDVTVSQSASKLFPYIQTLREKYLDRKYLKQIGVVLFEVYVDTSNNKLAFSAVEAYTGSLDRNAKDEDTKVGIFIDDIINYNSTRINFFSNVQNTDIMKKASTFYIKNQVGTVLGFDSVQTKKHVSYLESIMNPLTRIFDSAVDSNRVPLDLIIDAGVSNIAAYVKTLEDLVEAVKNDETISEEERERKLAIYMPNNIVEYNPQYMDFVLDQSEVNESENIFKINSEVWKVILQKYDTFARNTRKDLLFIADGIRQFCLYGYSRKIRLTDLTTSVTKQIVPYVEKLQCLNSSYSTGYCNWFLTNDRYSNDVFWIPPSIKAAGRYVYNDIYYNQWNAVAGVNRGIVGDVTDCAFSPTNAEAGKIYLQSWNYAVNYQNYGVTLEGQKTFQLKKTALDRVNIRRLLLYLEKRTKEICRRFLYEGNTPYNRQRLVDQLTSVFDNCRTNGGISEFAIRCDETNNTTQVIENNELRVDIAIKPVKVVEYIVLSFVTTSQSADVNEEVRSI